MEHFIWGATVITIGAVSFVVGAVLGAQSKERTTYLEMILARKEAGKLSRIIGRQRFAIAELKAKLASFQPVLTNEEKRRRYEASKPTSRPNLPH